MKTFSLITFFLIISLGVFSQSIEFRHGTWKEMLAAAKKENKMVIADFSTVWCGVCRLMEKNVFTEEKVGKFFNAHFICCQFDAEVGEGKQIARQYEIGAFPTFLFVDHNGNIVSKIIGYKSSEEFIGGAEAALREFQTNGKTMQEWEAEYARKKNNPAFILKYLKRREQLALPNADVLDQYCRVGKEKDLKTPEFVKLITDRRAEINAGGPCYQFITTHLPDICLQSNTEEKDLLYLFRTTIIEYSKQKAIHEKEDTFFSVLRQANTFLDKQLGRDTMLSDLELRCSYYSGIRNVPAYEAVARQLAEYLLKDKEQILRADSLQYALFLEALVAAPQKLDSLISYYNPVGEPLNADLLRIALRSLSHERSGELSFRLSDLAKQANQLAGNPEFLEQVLFWAIEAVALYDHFSNEAVLAEVMYKAGHRPEALRWMREARRKAIRDMKTTEGFAARMLTKIQKMEEGE